MISKVKYQLSKWALGTTLLLCLLSFTGITAADQSPLRINLSGQLITRAEKKVLNISDWKSYTPLSSVPKLLPALHFNALVKVEFLQNSQRSNHLELPTFALLLACAPRNRIESPFPLRG